jgi:putative ABC transport system permease protein
MVCAEVGAQRLRELARSEILAYKRHQSGCVDLWPEAHDHRCVERDAEPMSFLEVVRHAWRVHSRHPLFASLAILAFSVALGLNTSVYAVLDALLNPRIRIENPTQLYVPIYEEAPYTGERPVPHVPELIDALKGATTIEGATSYGLQYHQFVSRGQEGRDAEVAIVAPNFFDVLRVTPIAGRVFDTESASDGVPIVISDKVRTALFRQDQDPIGVPLRVGKSWGVIVAVVNGLTGVPPQGVDVWLPAPPATPLLGTILRTRTGVHVQTAFRELDAVRARFAANRGVSSDSSRLRLVPAVVKPFHRSAFLVALFGSVTALLLLAALNIAALQIARAIDRTREFGTRVALGASRITIIAQLVAEATLLAIGGLIGGLLLARWGMEVVRATIPPSLADYAITPQWSWRVFLGTATASAVIVCIAGVIPALRFGAKELAAGVRVNSATDLRSGRSLSGILTVCQLALAVALCVAGASLGRAALAVEAFDSGVDTRGLVAGSIMIPPGGKQSERLVDAADRLVTGIRALPNIVDAAAARPLAPRPRAIVAEQADGSQQEIAVDQSAEFTTVTPRFFRTLGVRLTKGRDFFVDGEPQPSVILSETAARLWWPRGDALGLRLKLGPRTSVAPWVRVVGIHDELRSSVRSDANAKALVHYSFDGDTTRLVDPFMMLYARANVPAASAAAAIRRHQPGGEGRAGANIEPYERALGLDILRQRYRFLTGLFVAFGTLGLGTASFGAYAISAHAVSRRTREFAVRLACGANRRDILTLVLRENSLLALLGIVGGLTLALWAAGILQTFLLGATALDARLFGIVALVLFIVVLMSTLPAAVRAATVDLNTALRSE